MAIVLINGQEVEIGDDERLNGIQVAARVGVEVPHYCWHPGLSVVASCRMCLVETGKRDADSGEISMLPKLVPGCQTPARDGTVFVTDSEKVRQARAMVEEDLLIRHPVDCPICDKAGECHLQDYHFEHGRSERRADIKPFHSRRRELGDTVALFVDRCVMCTRCVRFTREVSGDAELMVVHRGAHEEIDVFPGFPLENKLSGNVVDLCPVGALGDLDFLYSQRVWFMKQHASVCAGCSTGCSIQVEENQDRIHRLKPRENPHINQWWMCDEGRYGWKYVHDNARCLAPRQKIEGVLQPLDWSDAPAALHAALTGEAGENSNSKNSPPKNSNSKKRRLAAVLSPFLTVEEAYLLATYIRQYDENAVLALGRIPQAGADESFPNGFTIRAEKCPNRRGVEMLLSALTGDVLSWESFLEQAAETPFDAVWISGGYPPADGNDAASKEEESLAPELLAGLASSTLIVQDLFASALWRQADIQLPGAAFVERSGSFVNAGNRLQSFEWAIRPPAGVMTEGQLYWRLLDRDGLYNARRVLEDVAREHIAFAAATSEIPATGVDLLLNQLV